MRRGLSFILVLLLVLRGLLGDAMAMGTAPVVAPTASVHHPAPTASEHSTAKHGMSSHGAEHADPTGHDTIAAATTACSAQAPDCSHEHGPTCSACGVCHSTLFTPELQAQLMTLELTGDLGRLPGGLFQRIAHV